MLGPEGVIAAILGELERSMPAKLTEFRVRYGADKRALPDIQRYLTTEPTDIGIDKPPLIVITEQESTSINGQRRLTGDGSGGAVYEFNYRIGVFGWATGDTYASTALARQRLGLAIREVLMQRPGLGDPDPGTCVLNPLEMSESYSSVAQSGSSRMILAATALVVEYRAQEYLGPIRPTIPQTAPPSADTGIAP